MHYFIDGYNLLFRLMHAYDDLQSSREHIILDLNKKISLVKIDVSIVFDATFQVGERTRSHFNQLEILFTAEGETADEFILDELKNSSHPQHEIVITSDKKLAWQARRRLARTESVEEFLQWLNKSYKNKLKQLKTPRSPAGTSTKPSKPAPESPSEPSPTAKSETRNDYYERIFEAHYEELIKKEKPRKQHTPANPAARQKKRKTDPFQNAPSPPLDAPTQMERWQKAFEDRLKNPDPPSKY